MVEEKKRFVLYEYLLFFWRKKWLFLIVSLITCVLIASAIYMFKADKKYTGQMIVFTGSINSPDLTNPNNILSNFKDLNADIDIFVSEKGQVKFTIKDDNKKIVSQKLDAIAEEYMNDLLKNYNDRRDLSNETLQLLEERVAILFKSTELYKGKLGQDLPIDVFEDVYSLNLVETEEEITSSILRMKKIESDLLFFLQPEVLFQNVYLTKTYVKESIAIGLILGVLLTVALLMLLKYLGDARRNYTT